MLYVYLTTYIFLFLLPNVDLLNYLCMLNKGCLLTQRFCCCEREFYPFSPNSVISCLRFILSTSQKLPDSQVWCYYTSLPRQFTLSFFSLDKTQFSMNTLMEFPSAPFPFALLCTPRHCSFPFSLLSSSLQSGSLCNAIKQQVNQKLRLLQMMNNNTFYLT